MNPIWISVVFAGCSGTPAPGRMTRGKLVGIPAAVVVDDTVAPALAEVLGWTMMDVGTVADEAESVAVGRIVCGDAGDTVLEGSTVLGGGVVGVPVSSVVVALVLPLLRATGVTELPVSVVIKVLELAVEIEPSAVPEVVVEAEDCVDVTLTPVVNEVEPVVVDPVAVDTPEVVVAVVDELESSSLTMDEAEDRAELVERVKVLEEELPLRRLELTLETRLEADSTTELTRLVEDTGDGVMVAVAELTALDTDETADDARELTEETRLETSERTVAEDAVVLMIPEVVDGVPVP